MWVCVQLFSHVQLLTTPQTVAHQGPLSMGFSRQEYWSRLPFSPLGGLPNPGIKPVSSALADSFFFFFSFYHLSYLGSQFYILAATHTFIRVIEWHRTIHTLCTILSLLFVNLSFQNKKSFNNLLSEV